MNDHDCCVRPGGHSGPFEWICSGCDGTGRCAECGGAACSACAETGRCGDGCDLGTYRAWPRDDRVLQGGLAA